MLRTVRRCLAVAVILAACAPVEDDGRATPAADDSVEQDGPAAEIPPEDTSAKLRWVRANACPDQSPMSLTASDGTGLKLSSLEARAAVEGPIALTELTLAFDNPEDRQLEGRFAITLPPGAAISRFAMKIDGRWQEGEVVERQAARRAYEDFLHRGQDPALLENDAGNVFRARVFPIPARAKKELVISYSQNLPAEGEPWRLPLCGLPKLAELDVDVAIVRGAAFSVSSIPAKSTAVQHLTIREQDFSPTKDLEAWAGRQRAQGVRNGDLAIARVKPDFGSAAAAPQDMTILFDTSASRALDFEGQVTRLGQLIASLSTEYPGLQIRVAAFDQDLEIIYAGEASGFDAGDEERILARGALGASNLKGAFTALREQGSVGYRLLLVSDGVVTAGPTEAAELRDEVVELEGQGLQRIDALVDGGIQDAELLGQLTTAGPQDGIVLDARMQMSAIVDRLGKTTRSGIGVSVPGAEWVWPKTLDAVQPGDEVLVFAQLPPQAAFEVQLDGIDVADASPSLSVVPGPLLARAHAEARIASMSEALSSIDPQASDAAKRRANLKESIIDLSTKHRVLSDFTALLVLETEDDYRRFGIDRNALTDILTVGPAGVGVIPRVAAGKDSRTEIIDELPPDDGDDKDAPLEWGVDKPEENKSGAKKKEAKADNGLFDGRFDAPADPAPMPKGDGDAIQLGGSGSPLDGMADEGGGGDLDEDTLAEELVPHRGGPSGGVAAGVPAAEPEPEPEIPPAAERTRRTSRSGSRGRDRIVRRPPPVAAAPIEKPHEANPWEGQFDDIQKQLARGETAAARKAAAKWRADKPGDVLALVALGDALDAEGDRVRAARAYGSLIDLFPSRADLRRMAGARLERLGDAGLDLAVDTYDKAVKSRPDHPSGARMLAYALLKQGKHAEAFTELEAAFDRRYPSGRFAEIHRILREDLGLIGRAWIAHERSVDKKVRAALSKRGAFLPTTASTRFVLSWETDANDVDLHVYDAAGHHAYYSRKVLASGGHLYADVTTGFGPECFTIEGEPKAGPYRLQAHYYRRGPMGYGMGTLQIVEHDGKGGLTFAEHPFVIMRDDAYVDLATVK